VKNISGFGIFLISFVLLSIFVILSCNESLVITPENTNSMSGVIVDEQGTPIPGATLEVSDSVKLVKTIVARDTTDEDGKFFLSKLPDDLTKLNVIILHPDFKHFTSKLSDVKSKNAPVKMLHNDSCDGVVNFSIFNKSDSSKMSDVEIRLFRTGTLIRKGSVIDGYLTFEHVCPGTYITRIFKTGYGLIYDSVVVSYNDTINKQYYLHSSHGDSCCHGVICVTPLDTATGNGLDGVTVDLYSGNSQLNSYKYQGTPICFTSLCPGTYYIHLNLTGYNGVGIPITLGCNDSVSIH